MECRGSQFCKKDKTYGYLNKGHYYDVNSENCHGCNHQMKEDFFVEYFIPIENPDWCFKNEDFEI